MNRLTRVVKEGRLNMEVTYDSMANTDTSRTEEASIEIEKTDYALQNIFGHENQPTGTFRTVRWNDNEPQDNIVEPVKQIPHNFRVPYWQRLRKSQERPKSTRRKKEENEK